jgi:hypothetical protein
MKAKANRQGRQARRPQSESEPKLESLERLREFEANAGSGPILTGGNLDADWQRAATLGEEAVGGSVATPGQDCVDEIAEALGAPQAPDAEVRMSEEILRGRDRHLLGSGVEGLRRRALDLTP